MYQSGFCSSGSHEGTKPKGILTGTPMKVCEMWQVCECSCHAEITKMFEMTGQERMPVPNPEYRHPEPIFWMPSDEPNYGLPEPAPDTPETVGEDTLQVTETGRTRKGGLELAVQRILLEWASLQFSDRPDCTVKWLCERVFEVESAALDKAPSQGAVGAVLSRWEAYGYVLLGQKPVRIIGLTPDGKTKGLDWCRARYKKEH